MWGKISNDCLVERSTGRTAGKVFNVDAWQPELKLPAVRSELGMAMLFYNHGQSCGWLKRADAGGFMELTGYWSRLTGEFQVKWDNLYQENKEEVIRGRHLMWTPSFHMCAHACKSAACVYIRKYTERKICTHSQEPESWQVYHDLLTSALNSASCK